MVEQVNQKPIRIPSVFLVIIKDLLDFFIIVALPFVLTLAIYFILPTFVHVKLSFYFFEQFLELFLVNQKLVLWFLGQSFGVSMIYFLITAMLYGTTVGGLLVRITIVDKKSHSAMRLHQAILMAIGAYFGVLLIMVSPLFAWWLDPMHRGWSEKFSGTILAKK